MRCSRQPLRMVASVVLLSAVTALAGCGGSDSTTESAPTPTTPAVCSDLTTLGDSVKQLQNVTIAKGAAAEVQGDLKTIEQDLQTLSEDAKDQYGADIAQLSTSLDTLSNKVKALLNDPSAENLAAVRDLVRSVGAAADSLSTAVSSTC